MAVAAWKSCFKFCGYLCGALAALNIWFFIGLTIFQSTNNGNPYLVEEMLGAPITSFKDYDKFITVFGICIGVSSINYVH